MRDYGQARIDQMVSVAQSGAPSASRFLDPAAQYEIAAYLKRCGIEEDRYTFYGGYSDAERKVLLCLPDWCEKEHADSYADVVCVKITGSGFVPLHHPQYLGSLLALGIERDTIGDIVLLDEHSALLFLQSQMERFLCSTPPPLCRVGSDTVRVMPYTVPDGFCAQRPTELCTDTVSATRLDCIVAALAKLSRQRAKEKIAAGQVRLNFVQQTAPDTVVREGDTLSIRGQGRFVIESCSEKTKKDRIRLRAIHMI